MTTTDQPVRPPEAEAAPAPVRPRRTPWSRLSAGHLVMLVAALVAVVANYAVLRSRDESVRVAVAAVELRPGDTVSGSDLAYREVRVDEDLLATLVTPERQAAVEGWVTASAVAPGELITGSDLQAPSAPAAQRAMSVPVDPEHAVGGDLQAGDRIDIIEVEGRSARYLVTDAEVLAVPDAGTGLAGGLQSFSVTIAVDDESALEIAVAIRGGQLDIVRSTGAARATTERVDVDSAGADAGGAGVDHPPTPAEETEG